MSDPRLKEGDQALVEEAWKILRGPGGDAKELRDLANRLKGIGRFGLARRIIGRAREDHDKKIDSPELSVELRQEHALCTYKDPDLPKHLALDRALEILDHEGDLGRTRNQETLGLAGAIYKRKWEVDAHKSNLERSLYYYERGDKEAAQLRRHALEHNEPIEDPDVSPKRVYEGYTSINAAFVLDQLAHLEEGEADESGVRSDIAARRRQQAEAVRNEIIATLPEFVKKGWIENTWWPQATVAEAQFGIRDYSAAAATLKAAEDHKPKPWMQQATAEQLARLASLQSAAKATGQEGEEAQRQDVVRTLVGGDHEAVGSLVRGKLGLALSGGGFRASLFHIGVLARLAEQDLLRHVHVLSCVSGGSIVGAHYYLEVRKLLQDKWDRQEDGRDPKKVIHSGDYPDDSRDDYIALVERVAEGFLAGVEKNLRTSVVGSFVGNLKMAFSPTYSRTDRLGDLFEKEIYAEVEDGGGKKRYLDQLRIMPRESRSTPEERPADFSPKRENWKRRNKVPMLVLNATSLNTGHNWQFTSTWMGESPFSIDEDIDGNWRLRRMWYSEAPDQYKPPSGKRRIRLGKAVGASACVPGLFEPVALPELYPKDPICGKGKDMTVRLVDGGVHDNQGVASLLEQDCDVLIVSDASGQMTSQLDPGSGVVGTMLRMNSVLMERVRQAQFQDLKARKRAGLLKGLMVVHMKKGLSVDPVDWKQCEEPPDIPLRKRSALLEHGVLRNMQELLAGVRTDLDSFSEVEANALMANGYLMAAAYIDDLGEFPRKKIPKADRHAWSFLKMEQPLYTRGDSGEVQNRVERMLAVASKGVFKIWSLCTPLKVLSWLLLAALVGGFVWLLATRSSLTLFELLPPDGFKVTIGSIGWVAGTGIVVVVLNWVLGRALSKAAMKLLEWRETLWRLGLGLVMATLGAVVALIHILAFDKLFLWQGRLKRALKE